MLHKCHTIEIGLLEIQGNVWDYMGKQGNSVTVIMQHPFEKPLLLQSTYIRNGIGVGGPCAQVFNVCVAYARREMGC